jgi:hypothetical protein
MPKDSIVAKVAEHDAANRRPSNDAAEEAEIQERIARQLKPAVIPGAAAARNPVIATPPIAAALAESLRPDTGPDGEPIPALSNEDQLRLALGALIGKLEQISAHADFKAVWQMAKQQGLPMRFPVWKPEADFAKTLLK